MLRLPDSLDTTPSITSPSLSERLTINKRTTLHFTPGYAFIISNYIVPEGFSGSLKQGLHLDAGIDRISPSGFGGGVRYMGYFASGNFNIGKNNIDYEFDSHVHYIAMEFVVRRQTRSGKWGLNASAGFGMAYSAQKMNGMKGGDSGIAGFGLHATLGGEYLITRNIGIAIQSTIYTTRFSKDTPDLMQHASSSYTWNTGISFISINGGLRLHF